MILDSPKIDNMDENSLVEHVKRLRGYSSRFAKITWWNHMAQITTLIFGVIIYIINTLFN